MTGLILMNYFPERSEIVVDFLSGLRDGFPLFEGGQGVVTIAGPKGENTD